MGKQHASLAATTKPYRIGFFPSTGALPPGKVAPFKFVLCHFRTMGVRFRQLTKWHMGRGEVPLGCQRRVMGNLALRRDEATVQNPARSLQLCEVKAIAKNWRQVF